MEALVNKLCNGLSKYNPVVTACKSGSYYISLTGSKVKQIRVANHTGHKLKRNVWQLRTDVMSSRENPSNRIYNSSALNQMIKDIK